ncbi:MULTISPECIES: hypothetical protein [Paenibacillus]|uniref:Uncharacterized protein n=1 Tax=Paenibacillus lautus TaxID=1401 RepID=A0A385TVX8_PAELA|nr:MULTISPECIES: hypothetical protein [Paenibacillus]AWP25198.1 hypothetical protein B9D94_00505 [Paenibacillus sp. Cedars]AYB48029.1 hypothetical protein D5F53_32395 [Paenibacillus lautus]MBX4152587.1 hypothetical protein [Paenibacillus lautus]VTR62922.1 Uncharacterised protein [Actinobacillus pleuropneumoniae]
MNDSIERSILLGAMLIVFILAATSAVHSLDLQNKTFQAFKQINEQDKRLFTTLDVGGKEAYSGAEVLQSIRQIKSINADIKVENTIFSKDLDIDVTDLSMIDLNRNYLVTFIRATNGDLSTVVFN